MYRLAYSPGDDVLLRKFVSKQLEHCIQTIFGPLNTEGHFENIDRVKEFMSRTEFLNELVGEKYSSGNGLLKTEVEWVQLIKNRYEDMLLKIKDQKHEYTFNEIGEGLLHLAVSFFSLCDYEYLYDYEDTEDAFDDLGIYQTLMDNQNYIQIQEKLLIAGREEFDTSFLECCEEEEAKQYEEDPYLEKHTKEEFAQYYTELWLNYFSSITNLSLEGYLNTDLFFMTNEMTDFSESEKWNDLLIRDVLFWDADFAFVLPLLNNKKAMNQFIKTCGEHAGYQIKNADRAVLSTDDLAYDI